MSTLSGKYRCELCKDDYPIDPPLDRHYINGVDISRHRTEGIKIGVAEAHPIHICDKCMGAIAEYILVN